MRAIICLLTGGEKYAILSAIRSYSYGHSPTPQASPSNDHRGI